MHVSRLNFKSCDVAISEGPYVGVGISSTATPEIKKNFLCTSGRAQVLKLWYVSLDPHMGVFYCKTHFNFPKYYTTLS